VKKAFEILFFAIVVPACAHGRAVRQDTHVTNKVRKLRQRSFAVARSSLHVGPNCMCMT
jgi:hypothetical protein